MISVINESMLKPYSHKLKLQVASLSIQSFISHGSSFFTNQKNPKCVCMNDCKNFFDHQITWKKSAASGLANSKKCTSLPSSSPSTLPPGRPDHNSRSCFTRSSWDSICLGAVVWRWIDGEVNENLSRKPKQPQPKLRLVGGFNPSEKYASQIGSSP